MSEQDSTRTTRDDLRTDSRRNFVYDAVKQALNGDAKIGTYDDPEWIEAVADHAAYLSMKVDDIEEFSVREARLEIDELINEWELDVVTNDFWTERKVTINE